MHGYVRGRIDVVDIQEVTSYNCESNYAQDIAGDEELYDIEVCNFVSTTIINSSS